MRKNRIWGLILSFVMMVTMLPVSIFAENIDPVVEEKTSRRIYLHAFQEAPLLTENADRTTVYMGDDVNISLAVDKPNKSENDSEKEYDLGGFTVKISDYYDEQCSEDFYKIRICW